MQTKARKRRSLNINRLEDRKMMAGDLTVDTLGDLQPGARPPADVSQVLVTVITTADGASPIVIGDNLPAGVAIRTTFLNGEVVDQLMTTDADQNPADGVNAYINPNRDLGVQAHTYDAAFGSGLGFEINGIQTGVIYNGLDANLDPQANSFLQAFEAFEAEQVMTIDVDFDGDGVNDFYVADDLPAGTAVRQTDGSVKVTTHGDWNFRQEGSVLMIDTSQSVNGFLMVQANDFDGDGEADYASGFFKEFGKRGIRSLDVHASIGIA
ncbi:MAG: hypothetical protein WBD31_02775 [Rubripirellula sp.]